MWNNNPSEVCDNFFRRLGEPSWRKMKLMESLLLTMKTNSSFDFPMSNGSHLSSLSAFYSTGLRNCAQWITSAFSTYANQFSAQSSEQEEALLKESMRLLEEVLSWPWPHRNETKYVVLVKFYLELSRKQEWRRI